MISGRVNKKERIRVRVPKREQTGILKQTVMVNALDNDNKHV
jgi:hypothetical protein